MNAEILCIGSEILLGDIVNTNGAFLAQQLAALGIDIYHQSVVGDNANRLKKSLELALSRSDMVITTGGLGPTYDDLTKRTIADYFGVGMELHKPSMDKIRAFESRKKVVISSNKLQAMVPKGAYVFFNDSGFAPGIALEKNGKTVIMLPGPPHEMCPMFLNKVIPYLQKGSNETLRSKTIYIFGMGESQVEQTLRDMMTTSTNPTIAPYAKQGEVQVRVSAKAKDADAADALLLPVIDEIHRRIGNVIYGIDIGNLQNAVVLALKKKNMKVGIAESCTGGGLSHAITDIPGSSTVFECGICTYSNDMKQKLLGVKAETLEQYGAISAETAAEMAKGIRSVSGADIGVGITGIAGPDGGSEENPVGLVYVSIDNNAFCDTHKLLLSRGHKDEREFIRYFAVQHALSFILTAVNKA
ncbi:MAG: competence/damage-inducible protein A [Christensenellales bacterium]|jgi:nicotinamide-nucleotide amidase